MQVRHVARHEIIDMIRQAVSSNDLGLRDFYELGRQDQLVDPGLRDLWLIWGSSLQESDLAAAG